MSEKVCIIGAGASGLTAMRALEQQQIPFDCFEMGSDIGGNWRFDNDNGRSSAYRSLHIDTSKGRMQFSDLPMPAHYPAFPHHSQVLAYFEQYADHFDLRRRVTFQTRVEKVEPAAPGEAGGYRVTTRSVHGGETRQGRYRAVMVCNGHHWLPKMPDFPGKFSGRCTHSHHYRDPEPYLGQRVLVVGIGNSGADIASELSRAADRTFLAMRRRPRIIPRYVMGFPLDQWTTPRSSRLPLWLQQFAYRLLLKMTVGDQTRYGFPNPDHAVLTEHPTVSSELLNIVAHGGLTLKPNVQELRGDQVLFEDGSLETVDAIIYATGYQIAFPFLDPDFFRVEDNEVALYRKVVSPDHPDLYFIGLIQPLGAIMPLAEQQARWAAELISGAGKLPDREAMRREIERERAEIVQRYVRSTRHTIQVDYFPYLRLIEQERRDCLKRGGTGNRERGTGG